MNPRLISILSPAYAPCQGFAEECIEMRWRPDAGHVPRGFSGACGNLEEVEVVIVVAEPGDPHRLEKHTGLESAYKYAWQCFENSKDLYHRNFRYFVNLCFPNVTFYEQMKKVWLTESVLCSAPLETGPLRSKGAEYCIERYLLPQLRLFPNAKVVAFGGKAQSRLKGKVLFHSARALAPPGCNHKGSRESWQQVAEMIRATRRGDSKNHIY